MPVQRLDRKHAAQRMHPTKLPAEVVLDRWFAHAAESGMVPGARCHCLCGGPRRLSSAEPGVYAMAPTQ